MALIDSPFGLFWITQVWKWIRQVEEGIQTEKVSEQIVTSSSQRANRELHQTESNHQQSSDYPQRATATSNKTITSTNFPVTTNPLPLSGNNSEPVPPQQITGDESSTVLVSRDEKQQQAEQQQQKPFLRHSSSSLIDWTLDQVVCGRFCASSNSWLDDDLAEQTIPISPCHQLFHHRHMTTATLDEGVPPPDTPSTQPFNNLALRQTAAMARGLADDAGRAIGNLLPTASLQQITTRKYTLPDKTVASQVLMYRQLLHTKCRPGLKLSRDFQGTPAQKAVMHMPWWEQGIEETKKMVISYDNLITRLWLNGAIDPFNRETAVKGDDIVDLLDMSEGQPPAASSDNASTVSVETYITEEGLPPIPHQLWVDRLGFQQPDPVTDFRSGGVLSLAMMVYMVESQPEICQRFFTGDAAVLPFGITCINVTDMIAKFLMLAKSTDRMDALLSQKPFWRMFADPNAILAVQELAMTMLADVVVELGRERQIPILAKQHSTSIPGDFSDKVTVFDFSTILERTERRVRDDLLGAGPKTVDELRTIAARLRVKYQNQLDKRIERASHQQNQLEKGKQDGQPAPPPLKDVLDKAGGAAGAVAGAAGALAGGLFAKVKNTGAALQNFNPVVRTSVSQPQPSPPEPSSSILAPTIVDLPPPPSPVADFFSSPQTEMEGDWAGTDIASATDAISNFSIGDDEEDDML